MSDTFGIKLGVEGEKDFKKALSEISQNFKVLGSEMQLVTSQFDKNDKSVEALTARNNVLNKEIEEQKNKIETLQKALANASASFGENDKRTQNWQVQLNKATAELNNMERELSGNNKAIASVGDEFDDSADSARNFTKEIDNSSDHAGKAQASFQKLGTILKSVGVAVGAAMAAIGTASIAAGKQIYEMANNAADAADNIDKESQRLGMSKEAFQEWDYILSQNGISIDSMTIAMKSMTTNMNALAKSGGEGTTVLEQLGVSVEDLRDKSQEEIFKQVVTELQKMPQGYEKATLAQQIFGKQGQEMLPLLNQSCGSIEELKNKAHELGMVMSDEAVTAGVKYKDSIDTLQRSFQGFKNSIGADILPGLTAISDGLTGVINGQSGASDMISQGAEQIVTAVTGGLPKIVDVVMAIVSAVAKVAPEIIKVLVRGIVDNLPVLVNSASAIITEFIAAIIAELPEIADGALQLVLALADGIINNLPALVDAAIQVIATLAAGIAEALPDLIPAVVEMIMLIVKTITDNLPLLLEAGLQLFLGFAEGIIKAIPVIIESLPQIIDSIVSFIICAIPMIIQAGIQLFTAIVQEMPTIIEKIVEALPQIISSIVDGLIEGIPMIIEAGVQLFTALIVNLPEIIANIVMAIPQIVAGIAEGFGLNGSLLSEEGPEFFSNLVADPIGAIQGVVIKIPVMIAEICRKIKEAAPQIAKTGIELVIMFRDSMLNNIFRFAEVGTNIAKGIVKGIMDSKEWIDSQIAKFCADLLASTMSHLKIHSPSKVFEDKVGMNMGLGIGVGFEKSMKAVNKDIQNAINTDFDVKSTPDINKTVSKSASLSIPIVLDGSILSQIITEIQWDKDTAYIRNAGLT